VPVSEHICRKLVHDLAAGATIEVDRYDGTRAGIVAASCLGPTEVDPCEQEASS
jgi:hypothetical protein